MKEPTPIRNSGYRALEDADIELMDDIYAKQTEMLALISRVHAHLAVQKLNADGIEQGRIAAAEPHRWAAIAKTDIQQGFMALIRAVAQPGT